MSKSAYERMTVETRDKIISAYMYLCVKMPLNKVSVTAICKKAEINRGTFYLHYCDVNELGADVNNTVAEKVNNKISETISSASLYTTAAALMYFFMSERELCAYLYSDSCGVNVAAIINSCNFQIFCTAVPSLLSSKNGEVNYEFAFLCGAVSSVLELWVRSGMKEDPEKLMSRLEKHFGMLTLQLTD